ncbi:hypothetical protein MAPG_06374 [Magnaporthiopsis poae ATCC 64411]|uniref:Secreted protein n=1 Tax=Magnaporthiopsis poae (strain ATCC 64411 / 73-15) TaxID=644358 RepID=A0A0C4E1V3_MAGP6|nr:hypothetical protein MAPG_06374 [Magnaporthiopsis poae ATCC 64411]
MCSCRVLAFFFSFRFVCFSFLPCLSCNQILPGSTMPPRSWRLENKREKTACEKETHLSPKQKKPGTPGGLRGWGKSTASPRAGGSLGAEAGWLASPHTCIAKICCRFVVLLNTKLVVSILCP